MSRWFRHYAGMMRDEKLVRSAVKAGQPVERVVWVWGAILESAAEINDGGRYEFDAGEVAYFLRCDESDITGIVGSLEGSGRLAGGVVARWGDRQFSSDAAAERQRRYRARKSGSDVPKGDNHHNGDAESDVTLPSPNVQVTPQETETELDTEKKAQQIEPVPRAPNLLDRLFEAAGIAGFREERHPGLLRIGPIHALMDQGYDLETDILPVIRDRARNVTFNSWSYFVGAITDAARAKSAIPPKPDGPSEDWNKRLAVWKQSRTWAQAWGPKPDEPGCKAPPELLKAA